MEDYSDQKPIHLPPPVARMKVRKSLVVPLLVVITFGIYGIVWYVKTKNELVKSGGDVPTAWLMIIPIAHLYWDWKYYNAAGVVTSGKVKAGVLFSIVLVGQVADAAISIYYNSQGDLQAYLAVRTITSLMYLGIFPYLQHQYNKVAARVG